MALEFSRLGGFWFFDFDGCNGHTSSYSHQSHRDRSPDHCFTINIVFDIGNIVFGLFFSGKKEEHITPLSTGAISTARFPKRPLPVLPEPRARLSQRYVATICMKKIKIPTIEDIEQRYVELLKLIEDNPKEKMLVQTKAGALCLSIHMRAAHLERQLDGDLEKKMLLQKTVNDLKNLEKSLPFKSFSTSVEEIKEYLVPSFELFKRTLKKT